MRMRLSLLLLGLAACNDFAIGERPPAPELQVTPAAASTGPMGRVTFTPAGGVPPYRARASLAASGGAFEGAADGAGPFVYRAGPRENTLDALELADAAGTKLTASVQVGPRLTASAPAIAAYDGPFTVTAAGGNPPYLLVRGDGSTPFTGTVDAPPPPTTVTAEKLAVEDSAQQRVELTVEFRATLAFPDTLRVQAAQPSDVGAYVAKLGRGVPPFSFAFDPEGNSSGATLTSAGAYVAGANVGVTDLVTVTDGTGKPATLKIAVASPTFPLSGRTLVVGDFDGNGAQDLVALGGHSVGEGTAAFIASSAASPPRLVGDVPFRSGVTELSRPVALDVDGDGTSDLVTAELVVSPADGTHSTRLTVWSGAPGGLGPALQVLTLARSEARALTALPPGTLPSGGIAVVAASPVAGCVDAKGSPLQSPLAVFPVVDGRLARTPLCAETAPGEPPTNVTAAYLEADAKGTRAIAVVQSFFAQPPSVALHVLTATSVGAAQSLNLVGTVAGRQYELRAAADLDGDLRTDLALLETNAFNAPKSYRVAAVLTDCAGLTCNILSRHSTTFRDLSPDVDAGYPVLAPIRIGPRFELLVGASNGYTLERMRFLKLGLREPSPIDLRLFVPSLTSMPRSWDVAVGDFDLDGQDDLAIAGREISLLFGNGNGDFNQGDRFRLPGMSGLAPFSGSRRGVAYGDRGGLSLVGLRDGAEPRFFYGAARPELEPDFVVQSASQRALAFTLSGMVAVTPAGFAPVTADLSALRARGAKVLDGYGGWDFLADYVKATPPANSAEAFSLSAGAATTSGAVAVGADEDVVGLDDANGDGIADLLVMAPRYRSGAGRANPTTLRAYLGTGSTPAFASTPTDVQTWTVLANAGPLNGLRLFELAPGSGKRVPVAVFGDDADVAGRTALLVVGDSAGRFCAPRSLSGAGRSPRSLAALDLTGDKVPELAVVAFERAIVATVANGRLDSFGLLPRGTRPVGAWTLAPPEVAEPVLSIMDAGTESLFLVRTPMLATVFVPASAGLCP